MKQETVNYLQIEKKSNIIKQIQLTLVQHFIIHRHEIIKPLL